jgi:hypothetical protein
LKTISILIVALFCSVIALAQVKIGGSNVLPVNPNAVLQLESADRGLLLPRLGLVATTNPFPLSSFTAGILVYDTATTGDITPGLYYCDGVKWVKVNGNNSVSPLPNGTWSLTGNNATDPAINFIGTIDAKDMVFKTNNTEQLRLTKDGWLGIGTGTPQAALQVKGQVIIDSLNVGNIQTDSLLVADATGRIKAVSATRFAAPATVKKSQMVVATTGMATLTTPAPITDASKILLFRNGVMINFTVTGTNTIMPEVACHSGDELNIIQTL